MITIAFDLGLSGAVAAIGHRGARVLDLEPLDGPQGRRLCGRSVIHQIRDLVPPDEVAVAVIEDVRARPMGNGGAHANSMASQTSLVLSRGIVVSACDIARLPVVPIQPQAWKRSFALLGKDKRDSLDVARRLFPELADQLKRVKDHNRAEALLMARYMVLAGERAAA